MSDHDIIDVDGEEGDSVAGMAPAVVTDALVRPAAAVETVQAAFSDYQKLCNRLLDDDDYQRIGGRKFRKKSAWRKLAVAFGVSCEVRERLYERDDANNIIRAEVVVRAIAPNGRYMDGVGVCDVTERKFSKPNHDIPATAMTRATNRACADLFGMGEVSAEEITDESHYAPRAAAEPVITRRSPEVDEAASTRIVEMLTPLPESYRDEWKAWRKAESIAWPLLNAHVNRAMVKATELVERAAADSEPF